MYWCLIVLNFHLFRFFSLWIRLNLKNCYPCSAIYSVLFCFADHKSNKYCSIEIAFLLLNINSSKFVVVLLWLLCNVTGNVQFLCKFYVSATNNTSPVSLYCSVWCDFNVEPSIHLLPPTSPQKKSKNKRKNQSKKNWRKETLKLKKNREMATLKINNNTIRAEKRSKSKK